MNENHMSRQATQKDPLSLSDDIITISIGPSHPALRCPIKLNAAIAGDHITGMQVELGFMHRGFEKLAEHTTYGELISLVDRLNPVNSPTNALAFVTAVEKLMGIEIPERVAYLRMIFAELARIAGHFDCLTTAAIELELTRLKTFMSESLNVVLDTIETHMFMPSFGGITCKVDRNFAGFVRQLFAFFSSRCMEGKRFMREGGIFHKRLSGHGAVPAQKALEYGFSGPNLRASGIDFDLRRHSPYWLYPKVGFQIPTGTNGDCYDRYMTRLYEIEQSMLIIEQCIDRLTRIKVDDAVATLTPATVKPEGEVYSAVEAAEGELGYFIVAHGEDKPYRLHIRPPGLAEAGALPDVLVGEQLEQIVPLMGSFNFSGAELER